MEKLSRIGFLAIALIFIFSALAVIETRAQGLNEILKRMDNNYNSLNTLRTNVTFEKYDPVVRVSDKMEGKAIYTKKGKDTWFRVDWTKPVESLAVINKNYKLYRPRLQQGYEGNTDKVNKNEKSAGVSSPLAFINMSKAELKANYDMKYLGEETLSNGTRTLHLELTPKTAQKYKKADLWVDGNGMPIQMKTTENNNDTSSVLLSGVEKNVTLNGSDFKIDFPKGTKIVKN